MTWRWASAPIHHGHDHGHASRISIRRQTTTWCAARSASGISRRPVVGSRKAGPTTRHVALHRTNQVRALDTRLAETPACWWVPAAEGPQGPQCSAPEGVPAEREEGQAGDEGERPLRGGDAGARREEEDEEEEDGQEGQEGQEGQVALTQPLPLSAAADYWRGDTWEASDAGRGVRGSSSRCGCCTSASPCGRRR